MRRATSDWSAIVPPRITQSMASPTRSTGRSLTPSAKLDVRITLVEGRQPRHHDQVGHRRPDVHPHAALGTGLLLRQVGLDLVEIGQHPRGALVVGRALGRHGQAPGRALQQLDLQVRFELLHQLGHAGPRHLQLVGGARERAGLDDAGEHTHGGNLVHRRIISNLEIVKCRSRPWSDGPPPKLPSTTLPQAPSRKNIMTLKLNDKIALVTGGTSGIGLATAQRFVAEGAHVFITGRRQAELDAAVKEIGRNVTGVRATCRSSTTSTASTPPSKSKRAASTCCSPTRAAAASLPLGQITEAHFDKIFNTNVRGLLFTVQKALPLMPKGASIVLNASIPASRAPGFSVYSATKAAVRNLARSWMLDLKDAGIRVNAVSPGVVPTPAYELLGLKGMQVQGFIEMQAQNIPLGRVGTPDEIAKAVVFLASDDSSFVNGIELFVDGGMAQI
jgi:NAD(P)-dependent dehydrogenase (short-subunit alcohol dehydrogenase family)